MAQAIRENLTKWATNIGLDVKQLPNVDETTESMSIQGKVVIWKPAANAGEMTVYLESSPNVTYTDERELFVSAWVLPIEITSTPQPITLRWIETLTDSPVISIKLMGWTKHILEVAKTKDLEMLDIARNITTLTGEDLEIAGRIFFDRALERCPDFSLQMAFIEQETPWYDALEEKPPFGLLKLDVVNKWRVFIGKEPIVIPT